MKVLLAVLGGPTEVSRRDCWGKDRERWPGHTLSQVYKVLMIHGADVRL